MSEDIYLHAFNTIIPTNYTIAKKINMLQECLDFGIDINHNNSKILITAIEYGNLQIVQFLIDSGIDIHANSDLALIKVCTTDHIIFSFEILKLLLRSGAIASAQNNKSLENCILFMEDDVIIDALKLLIEHGADPLDTSIDLLRHARNSNLPPLVEYLLDIGIKCSDSLIAKVFTDNTTISSIKKLLLKHGANPNAKLDGLLLLEYAIMKTSINDIELLLEYGADVNLCYNIINQTLICKSRMRYKYNIKIEELLLEYGLDISWISKHISDKGY